MTSRRTRSQGLEPEDNVQEDAGSTVHEEAQKELQMSRELRVELEVLKLRPATTEGTTPMVQETVETISRPASTTIRPPSTIPSGSRPNSAVALEDKQVGTRFNKYHMVPIMNSTTGEKRIATCTGELLSQEQADDEEADNEVAEIVEQDSNSSEERSMDAAGKLVEQLNILGIPDDSNHTTMPAANTFQTIQSTEKSLKRYLPDGFNSQLGNVKTRTEVVEEGEKWYKVRIPYLERFYGTETFLLGIDNNDIYAAQGENRILVCVQLQWTPYNLVRLENCLRDAQYLKLKGVNSFREEGERIMRRLVSGAESDIPDDFVYAEALNFEQRRTLYEKRLKLTKAIPIMLAEMTKLEEENTSQLALYIKQKSEFGAALRMGIDQIDLILERDDQKRRRTDKTPLRTPKFYPTKEELRVETPAEIIHRASEEHEQCMRSIDTMTQVRQHKHTGIGKSSKKAQIPSERSAFQLVGTEGNEARLASPLEKERERREAIRMAAEFGNQKATNRIEETQPPATAQGTVETVNGESAQAEQRKTKRTQVLEQFLRESKRKGTWTPTLEQKVRKSFKEKQETEEKRLQEEERKRQMETNEILAVKLQREEEQQREGQLESERLRREREEEEMCKEFDQLQNDLAAEFQRDIENRFQQYKEREIQPRNRIKEGYEASIPIEPTTCWRCGETGHRKKECTRLIYCTNCGRNNHITSKCRLLGKEGCQFCQRGDHTEEQCPYQRLEAFSQGSTRWGYPTVDKSQTGQNREKEENYFQNNAHGEFQMRYTEPARANKKLGLPTTGATEASTQYYQTHFRGTQEEAPRQWDAQYRPENVTIASTNSEFSKAIDKISETNQLMAQHQITQQRTLEALLFKQGQSTEAQEVAQRVQSHALLALTDATRQRSYDAMFDRITKYDGKDPEKCHLWLNQVGIVCGESNRNFRQALMYCAEGAVLGVLSGLDAESTEDEVREELMKCFSSAPTRRQAVENLRRMRQERGEPMRQYLVRHEVAHERANKLNPNQQCSITEIIEFATTLQEVVQDKLLKRIDGHRPPATLREAYQIALELERRNQITRRYDSMSHINAIEQEEDVEYEEVDAMELRPRDQQGKVFARDDRRPRNFGPVGRGSFGGAARKGPFERRPQFDNRNKQMGRGNFGNFNTTPIRNFKTQQPKQTKWDATFQAYDIDGKALLEALKKLSAFQVLKENGPETPYSRRLAQQNREVSEKLKATENKGNQRTENPLNTPKNTKEIAEAFSAISGLDITEEEVNMIQSIQLPDDMEEVTEGDMSSETDIQET